MKSCVRSRRNSQGRAPQCIDGRGAGAGFWERRVFSSFWIYRLPTSSLAERPRPPLAALAERGALAAEGGQGTRAAAAEGAGPALPGRPRAIPLPGSAQQNGGRAVRPPPGRDRGPGRSHRLPAARGEPAGAVLMPRGRGATARGPRLRRRGRSGGRSVAAPAGGAARAPRLRHQRARCGARVGPLADARRARGRRAAPGPRSACAQPARDGEATAEPSASPAFRWLRSAKPAARCAGRAGPALRGGSAPPRAAAAGPGRGREGRPRGQGEATRGGKGRGGGNGAERSSPGASGHGLVLRVPAWRCRGRAGSWCGGRGHGERKAGSEGIEVGMPVVGKIPALKECFVATHQRSVNADILTGYILSPHPSPPQLSN